ncbi:hypothetical protein V6N11_003189 [Hibiscus sabdariffa]|uniref:Uncharacterized protein n=1 Tax=Hibiscus sabdariffa TaxID=183260 RepID=A0ABR2SCH3_9ROSI
MGIWYTDAMLAFNLPPATHMDPDPPLHETYEALFANTKISSTDDDDDNRRLVMVEERELPLIDLSRLSLNEGGEEAVQGRDS